VSDLGAAIVTAVVAAVLGGVATYFTARRDLQLKFDASLRDLRIDAYTKLWKELEKLAKYGRPDPLSKGEAQQLRDNLRDWYFNTGGLVLSTQTRQDYFTLLDALEVVIDGSDNIFGDEDDEFLRVLGSRLRTAMTRDVGTRRTFVFRGDAERDRSLLETRTYVQEGGTARLVLTSRRRFKLARPFKAVAALFSDEPELELELPYDAKRLSSDAARRQLAVRVAAGDWDPAERLFLIEEGLIVEGPKGWLRGETRPRQKSKIWKQDDGSPPQGR
jgi:hypothetical protein